MSTATKFFMVFNMSTKGPTSATHNTYSKAFDEAQRLARLHPNNTFVVMQSVQGVKTQEPPLEVVGFI